MNKVKIVHCADVHLDSPFSGLASKAAIRRDELRETFSNIINITKEENAQILLISGDLFDKNYVSDETIAFLKTSFSKIPDVKIFIAPGNHDPLLHDSCYITEKWPDNVHIFSNKPECVSVPEYRTRVYGVGFSLPYQTENLLNNFSADISDDYINIMTVHGDIVTPGVTSEYNPINIESVANSNLDYMALGHRHDFSEIERAGNTFYAYCGIPEGRGFDETGPKGIITGIVSKNHVELSFKPVSKRTYHEIMLDITGCGTHDSISNLILSKFQRPDCDANPDLYKIILTGTPERGFVPDLSVLQSRLSEKFFHIKFKERLTFDYQLETLIKENNLKGIFARKFYDQIEKAKKDSDENLVKKLQDALTFGLRSFDEEVSFSDN